AGHRPRGGAGPPRRRHLRERAGQGDGVPPDLARLEGGTAMTPGTDERPRPEQFLSLIRQQQRGRLKIYLGFAPGVGKTYEMLQEGQRLRRQGVDVVSGVVETHGRPETAALIGELEQVPRRRIEYRGVVLEEMD